MLRRIFGPKQTVTVSLLGLVGERVVRWEGEVRLPAPATVSEVLRAAGRAAGADLLAALEAGTQPALLLDGRRLDLPADLSATVPAHGRLTWLMPMAGG